MRTFLLSGCIVLLVYAGNIYATTLPGRPTNVTLLADDHNIAVSWEPPAEYNGIIRRYIITWAILPIFTDVSSRILVDANVTLSFIAIKEDIGRLFRVRVRAASEERIGEYSIPRYIRIGCGHNLTVSPENLSIVTSPGFNATLPLKSGVICGWQISTRSIYSLRLKFKYMDLFTTSQKRNCDQMQTYVNVSNVGLFCNADDVERDILTRQSSLTLSLMTGFESGGRGFSLLLSATAKSPGPPVNVTTRVTTHAIIVTWQPPVEETLPITSYILRYRVLPLGHAYRIVVGSSMRAFAVNKDNLEGKLFSFSVTAAIRSLEGEASSKVYTRASCQKAYYLQPGQSVNITSPNYPDAYPDSIVCIWTVQCSPEATLRITYYDFQLEDTPFCSSDYVIFSNKREPECARIKVPYFSTTRLQQINVTFVTDSANQYKGFLINFAAKAFSGYRQDFTNTDNTVLSTALTDFSPKTRKLPTHHKIIPSSAFLYSPTMFASDSLTTQTSSAPVSSASVSKSSPSLVSMPLSPYASTSSTYSMEQTSSSVDSSFSYPNSSALVSQSESFFSQTTFVSLAAAARTESSSSSTTLESVASLPVKTSHRKLSSNTTLISGANSSDVSKLSSTVSSFTSALNAVTSDPEKSFTVQFSEQTFSQTFSKLVLHHLTTVNHESGTTVSPKDRGVKEKGFGGDNNKAEVADILVPVLLSAAGCVIVACVVITVLCRRYQRRRKINIEYQSGRRYRRNHIELHDILLESQNTGGRKAIFKTVSSRDMFGETESRKRRSTFPFCYSLRKRKLQNKTEGRLGSNTGDQTARDHRQVDTAQYNIKEPQQKYRLGTIHQDIQRELRVFGSFIEDKDALEARLRRRHEHRRASSV